MGLIPFFPTPFSDLAWICQFQPHFFLPGSFCTELYLKYGDCLEAYGAERGKFKCADLYFDMQECMSGTFQEKRTNIIRNERRKQYEEGKLPKPFDQEPPPDSYYYL